MEEFGDRISRATTTMQRQIGVYSLLRELGRGGASTVYEAIDTRDGSIVALKALASVPYLHDEEQMSLLVRMERETRAVESLSHPNVVHILEVGFAGESPETLIPFFAMEFLNGQTVRQRLDRDGALPLPVVVHILDQAASALDAVHAAGVVHRDVKPGNLMLLDDDFVKLMDFGIARQGDDMTVTKAGMMIGSPAYMSPEQAAGRPATAESDVWGLSAVLYEMVTGTVAFDADNIPALLYQISYGSPRPAPATLPTAVRGVLLRALSRESGRRFTTAGDLAAAFRAAIANPEPPPLRRVAKSILPPSPPPTRSAQSNSNRQGLAYAVPLAVIAVASVGAFFALRPRAQTPVDKTAPMPSASGKSSSNTPDTVTARDTIDKRPTASPKPTSTATSAQASVVTVPKHTAPTVTTVDVRRTEVVKPKVVAPMRPIASSLVAALRQPKPVAASSQNKQVAVATHLSASPPPAAKKNKTAAKNETSVVASKASDAELPSSVDAFGGSTEPPITNPSIGTIGGMWKGTYADHPAVLILNRPSTDNGLFDGTLSVSTKDGDVMVNVRGHMKDDGSLKFHEQGIVSGTVKTWSLGSVTGNIDSSGGIAGGGRTANGAAYGWIFHRE